VWRCIGFLFLLLSLRPVSAPGAALGSSTDSSSPGGTSLSWTLALEDLMLAVGWQDCVQPFPAIAVETPWLVAGPLQPAGLLREVQNPLGFSAGSSVFQERTGLSLDLSILGGRTCFACLPIPGALGLFCLPMTDESLAIGLFVSAAPAAWLGMEAEIQVEDVAPAGAATEWFPDRPAFPGGALVQLAGRIRARVPGFAACGTIGCSLAETAPPGGFFHLESEYKNGPAEVALLVGAAGEGYRTPAGRTVGAQWRVSGKVGLHGRDDSVEVGCVIDIRRPVFVPRAYLAEAEALSAGWERDFQLTRGLKASARVEARKEISFDEWALREEVPSVSAVISLESKLLEAEGVLSWSASGGMQIRGLLTVAPAEALCIELEAGTRCLKAGCTLRDRSREISVKAGLSGGMFSFGLSWTAEGEAGGSARDP
jgi:hypothetical protein